ncbi:acetamidase/formamidase family protein [Ectobacillus ponti]|uniref:Acetamidase/formamidase family protein n=1 Tax=Ectobacillus ponti TaxID=2961894 RepID=A0AA42BRX2_9BACI|nr:acetamidase/formamidase family protein [Ectobacillus ponti]MCP8967813.1 acetamidase/formamidase family protein [Ectobacillus ponti]
MTVFTREACMYAFSKTNEPIATVASGSTISLETYDCFTNQLRHTEEFQTLDWNAINPATGPVYIQDAAPGDILRVKIERIEFAPEGVMTVGPGLGVLGDRLPHNVARPFAIEDGHVVFNENLRIPLNPMIGVIGVAPAGEAVSCGTPGAHGGNMDNKMITEGATLYFPVFVEGALFGLGDLHAAMGDGEIGVSGVEVAGKVTVTLDVMKGQSIPSPMLETDTELVTIASAPTLDEAVRLSVEQMADYLHPRVDLPLAELIMALSAAGQTQICQVVDPLMTARFVVSKSLFQLGAAF